MKPFVAVSVLAGQSLDNLPRFDAAGACHFPKGVFANGYLNGYGTWPYRIYPASLGGHMSNLIEACRTCLVMQLDRLIFVTADLIPCTATIDHMAAIEFSEGTAAYAEFARPRRGSLGCGISKMRAVRGQKSEPLAIVLGKPMMEYLLNAKVEDTDTLVDLAADSPWPEIHVHYPPLFQVAKTNLFDANTGRLFLEACQKDFLVVMTSPRAGTSYLAETLEALDLEGSKAARDNGLRAVVVSDGPLANCSWDFESCAGPSGTKKALWRIFQMGRDAGARCLIIIEDDVKPCKNAVFRILAQPLPGDLAFLSYFDLREFPPGKEDGIHRTDIRKKTNNTYWGLQTIVYPMEVVEFLLTRDPEEIEYLQGNIHASDTCMAELLFRHTTWHHVGIHTPNLVEHRGDVSAWGNVNLHRARNFPGFDFDALSLPLFT